MENFVTSGKCLVRLDLTACFDATKLVEFLKKCGRGCAGYLFSDSLSSKASSFIHIYSEMLPS